MNYLKGDIILLPYPFTDLSTSKIRPAVVISSMHEKYNDLFVVPITSKVDDLISGEFIISEWKKSGLNVISAIKRGCILIDVSLIRMKIGRFSENDLIRLNNSIKL